MKFDSLTQSDTELHYCSLLRHISLTCTGPMVAGLEGDLSLPTAVSHPAILALDPPPPGPGAGPAGGAAAAPAAPGGPLAGVPWEG